MRLELPILSYGVNYNRITTMERAMYFDGVEDIILTLRELPTLDLGIVASNLKWIADLRYNWSAIAKKYSNALQDASRQPVPAFDYERRLSNGQ
ncbi:MAG: hypothetical protein K9J37_12365 [Saprospiraceae bacterium]|nr:hypothetical protein [Saprospiraceae bacterium]MCF8310534.1 hypothetical protein [Saprospiraceae bacterium]MCF8440834.1 hypothetical protein [Saprospiraceae bacterium]